MKKIFKWNDYANKSKYLIFGLLSFVFVDNYSFAQTVGQSVKQDTTLTYTNPVGGIKNIGDPYVLKNGKNYFMYASSSGRGFKVWESTNLVDWKLDGLALDRDHDGNNWGKGNFWAPEVKELAGKFYMTYSAIGENGKMKIRIAVANDPKGPFVNWSEPFFKDDMFSYIDADLLIDNGKIYMYFVKDCSTNIIDGKHVSQIHVAELNKNLTGFQGEPKLIITPDQKWEGIDKNWQWNEGPFVMKHEGTYYLMYSANVYSSADYSIGYATASKPMGPWVKYAKNPILKKDTVLRVSGPGHNSVTVSPDGKEFFIVYHTHTFYDKPSGNRNMCIDRLRFENGVMKIDGPTKTPQPLPGGDSSRGNR